MNESAASAVLLLRAYETTGFAPWTDADRAWATRAALQSVGADASADDFLAARAQAGLEKLAPHDALLARWRALRPWRIQWLVLAAVLGLVAGLMADRVGSSQRINLLAPPVWAVIVWNLAVYAALLGQTMFSRQAEAGWLRRGMAGLLQRWRTRRLTRGADAGSGTRAAAGNSATVWQPFAADWASYSRPLNSARIALALHIGAATLGLGLMAGMYLRGLVLDYRVGWESTFLDADTVHIVLATLLAPASALSGIGVPDGAGLQALRVLPGRAPDAAASAAPWIHLYAWQLLLFVLLPRLALALWAGVRARHMQRNFVLPLHEPYYQRLHWQQRGGRMPVWVWPHARVPDAASLAALKALFAGVLGEGAALQVAATVAYGAEDEPLAPPPQGVLRVALFDLGATPEAETQGRLLRALTAPAAAPPLMVVDEAAFAQRFGATSPRLAERRQAWRTLAESLGSPVVFAKLQPGDLAAAEIALQAALQSSAASAPPGGAAA